ncbi:MAG: DUF4124 domain-containing protein [Thiohalocapsa sp.]
MNPSTILASRQGWLLATLAALVCLAAVGTPTEAADAQVYKCKEDGKITFSQEPCAGQERKVDIQYDQPSEAQTEAAVSNAESQQAEAGTVAEARLLDDEIIQTEQQINRLRIERDARLGELQEQRFRGSENRDEAAWLGKMNQEIESADRDYSARIISETARLDSLRARRAALGAPNASSGSPSDE